MLVPGPAPDIREASPNMAGAILPLHKSHSSWTDDMTNYRSVGVTVSCGISLARRGSCVKGLILRRNITCTRSIHVRNTGADSYKYYGLNGDRKFASSARYSSCSCLRNSKRQHLEKDSTNIAAFSALAQPGLKPVHNTTII